MPRPFLALQAGFPYSIMLRMRIAVGSDHAGYRLKGEVVHFLSEEGAEFQDCGVFTCDSADYPDVGVTVAEAVANGEFDRGILVCGIGTGMSMVANKVPGVRAALCGDTYTARISREHNDSNVLVLGERVTGIGTALDIVRTWLSTDFPGEERHVRRIRKISEIEQKYIRGGC